MAIIFIESISENKYAAFQAKCYSPNYEITKSDVDKFLSESNRKEINHRLLIATTDGRSLDKDASALRAVLVRRAHRVTAILGGLHHHYVRV